MTRPTNDDDGGDFKLGEIDDRPKYAAKQYLSRAVESERSREPKKRRVKPKFPFLTGIFEFPWYPASLAAWICLSLIMLATAAAWILMLTWGQRAGLFGVRAILPPCCILTVIMCAYAAACFMKTIEETAAGEDTIEDWPAAGNWKEWTWSFVFMVAVTFQAALVPFFLVGWMVIWTWIPVVALTWLVFPPFLLAAMDAGAWWPASPKVWRSIAKVPVYWAIFYGEWIAIVFTLLVVTLLGLIVLQFWSAIVVCPLAAAAVLMAGRLTGRLAQSIADAMPGS